jgi:ribonuclease HI
VVGVQDDNCGLPGRIQAVKNGRAQGHSCVCLAPIGGMNFIFNFSRSSRSADRGGRIFLLTNITFHISGGVNMTEITIYTDGSCQTQTRIGGWAAVLSCGEHRKALSGSAAETTVNAMELTAAVNGLNALKGANQTVTLITDSQYVARGVNEWMPGWIERGWLTANKKPVANRALWEQLHGSAGSTSGHGDLGAA